MGYRNGHTFTFSVLKGLKAGEPFIFTIQNFRCHRPPKPFGYLVLSRDNSNPHCQFIADSHISTAIKKTADISSCNVTVRQFVTH